MSLDFDNISMRTLAQLEAHETLDSTNDYAITQIKQGKLQRFPALVIAQNQTIGRGQRERSWWSSDKSLTFSWCYRPQQAHHAGFTPIKVAWCLLQAIEQTHPMLAEQIKIKWPNDLIIHQKKVAGILVERVSVENVSTVVIGIGLNVNQEADEFPQQVDNVPTSLKQALDSEAALDATTLLNSVMDELHQQFEVISENHSRIVGDVNSRILYLGSKIAIAQANKEIILGLCEGITADGGLLLRHLDDPTKLETVFSGTLRPCSETD